MRLLASKLNWMLKSFFIQILSVLLMSVAFYTWGGFDGLEAVVEGWWEFLNNGVFEFFGCYFVKV